jgi:hypothetical protein
MADPKTNPPQLPEDYRALAVSEIKRFLGIIEDTYRFGYGNGEADTISRILKAAKPDANAATTSDHSKSTRPDRTAEVKGPGADTHKLIETVLRGTPTGKATPTEIAASPANKTGIARDAIRNAMRRGKKTSRYVSDGKGRYSLGRTESQK